MRASWPPLPILSSTLCTLVPSGISPSGTAFPVRVSEPGTGHDGIALRQSLGVQDVALLSIGVHDQGDPGAPVGIVLDLGDLSRNAELVSLEVDLPVLPLVAAAPMARGQVALIIAASGPPLRLQQRLLRRGPGDFIEPGDGAEPGARPSLDEIV